MEIGADISGSINIDDYFIYDRDPELVTEVFEKILYQHITNSLEISMMYEERINSPSTLRQKIFLSKVVFRELTISAEGVIRDFLNIFGNCIALCERFKDERISTTIVKSAALKWYRGDKRDDLDQKEKGLLNTIVKYCIEKDVRAFLAPIEYRKHEILQRLVDRRTLHMLATSLELDLKEYDLYTIDYGAYSDFRNDGYSPIQRMSLKKKGPNSIQPFSCNDRWISFIKLK